MNHRLLLLLVLIACSLHGQQQTRNVDFRNFTFPFPPSDLLGVPGKMTWMDLHEKSTVILVNGQHDFDKDGPARGPFVVLVEIQYGYLTGSNQLDAMVVLRYGTGGTAHWEYVYAYTFVAGVPKLLGRFETGSRADHGLYHLYVTNGGFIVDLLDPDEREGDCCSNGFIRNKYVWRSGMFLVDGPLKYGHVDEEPSPR